MAGPGVETAAITGAVDASPFPDRWLRRSLPPPGAHSPERGVWIREQIIRDEVEGISSRGAQGQVAARRRILELHARRWV